jgi:hypothetical protein
MIVSCEFNSLYSLLHSSAITYKRWRGGAIEQNNMTYKDCVVDGNFVSFKFNESGFTYDIWIPMLRSLGTREWQEHLSEKTWYLESEDAQREFTKLTKKINGHVSNS